jgi:integrase/recombinase XerD
MRAFAQRRGLWLLKDFSRDILEAFQSERPESPITRSKKLERMRAFFKDAAKRAGIEENPALLLAPPKVKPKPTLPFSRAEMSRIVDAIKRYPDKSGRVGQLNSARLHAFVLTLRYSGLRIGEVTRLHVAHLDGHRIFLYTQKSGAPVYCVGESKPHTAVGTWQRTLRKPFKLAGIVGGHAHRFRDTYSVELLLSGAPIEDVSILLGHSNIKTTLDHYAPWNRDRQLRLESQLNRAWNRDPIVLLQESFREKKQNPIASAPN